MPADELAAQGGQRPALPVVLLHGYPGAPEDWDPLIAALSAGLSILPLTMPWMRGVPTTARAGAFTLRDVLEALLPQIGRAGPRVHLVGHDLGGAVAWWLAALVPRQIASLSAISAPHPRVYAAAAGELDAEGRRAYMHDILAEDLDAPLPPPPGTGKETVDAALRSSVAGVVPSRIRAFYANTMLPAALRGASAFPARLDLPVSVIHGEEDPLFPSELFARSVNEAGSARRIAMLQCAHFPHLEHPAELAQSLGQFWAAAERAPKVQR